MATVAQNLSFKLLICLIITSLVDESQSDQLKDGAFDAGVNKEQKFGEAKAPR